MAAARLSRHEISDLCLGKPALRSLSVSDTVGDALAALKGIDDAYVSVWTCNHSFLRNQKEKEKEKEEIGKCICIAKVCMVDMICFLSKSQSLCAPLSALIPECSPLVRHLAPTATIVEAIDVMYEGVHNLVIPIQNKYPTESDTLHANNTAYCWLTQEDVFRYLLNSIGVFSPTPCNPINTLAIIDTHNLFAVAHDDPASSALDLLALSLLYQSSVALLDPHGKFLGEISPFRLNSCDEGVVPALAVLSAADFTSFIHCGGPPEDLLHLLRDTPPTALSSFSSTGSDDDDYCFSGKNWKAGGYSGRAARRSEAIVCYRWSSLVAVMIQALAHRVSYVWVVEDDGTLTGIVTFQGMLKVFRDHLKSMC
ncbi:CBS domain-containing protein CBSX5 [Cajanus cajan]|uniref:CBS domain-containing protein n=1 Tax=Cajanus cajan TaxID=3821 RepID=A0A151T7A1_CAJCA|nr:CBS domain-containing protein CBSX5 [Cajanus cajan]KYP62938.1 hypothetical protein KK1_017499 [Cajanus cajan]